MSLAEKFEMGLLFSELHNFGKNGIKGQPHRGNKQLPIYNSIKSKILIVMYERRPKVICNCQQISGWPCG